MTFTQEDFSSMEFNVMLIPKGKSIFDHYKALGMVPQFREDISPLDPEIIMRYIVCMYSIGSPFLSIDDLSQRKYDVFDFLGIGQNTPKELLQEYNRVVYGMNKAVMRMIVYYVRKMHNLKFQKYVILEEQLFLQFLKMNDDAADHTVVLRNISNMEKMMEGITLSMFYGKDDKLEIQMLEEMDNIRSLELRPEDYARKEKKNSAVRVPAVPATYSDEITEDMEAKKKAFINGTDPEFVASQPKKEKDIVKSKEDMQVEAYLRTLSKLSEDDEIPNW